MMKQYVMSAIGDHQLVMKVQKNVVLSAQVAYIQQNNAVELLHAKI
jgi:hypothetical protein